MTISIAVAGWFFWTDVQSIIQTRGLVNSIVLLIIVYGIMGLFTAFLFWISFNLRAKEKYQEIFDSISKKYSKLSDPLKTACIKKEIISDADDLRKIFDDREGILRYESSFGNMYNHQEYIMQLSEEEQEKTLENYTLDVDKVFPPRFKTCKPYILGAAYCWPVTLIWLLFSRVVKQFINVIVSMFGGVFNKVAKLSFGRF
jgi:hypothetical protein